MSKKTVVETEFCECCFEKVNVMNISNVGGKMICNECVEEMSNENKASSFETLDVYDEDIGGMFGIMSDDEIVDSFRDDYF